MSSDYDREQLEHLSTRELEEIAFNYGLIGESESLEDAPTERIDELIGDIIKAKAESDDASEEASAMEQHFYEQKMNNNFS
ncbi:MULTISPECIES: hypothetical protein [Yersinia]|uniref:hypothetical protein n=1 Tax=Yersinia TaxID=629 RepID=UPI001CFD1C05|nr:hypothetical protein [Yersinia massiliensis]MCB5320152.1 hypothetical protein [Yersinia massiliensis]